jgi:hypothetical protein
MDLGINIADDLEELKNNLNKFKNSKERTSLKVFFFFFVYIFFGGLECVGHSFAYVTQL